MKNKQLATVTCYLDNSSDAVKQLDALFASETDGDLVITDVNDYLQLVRLGYSSLVKTLQDCSGKQLKIELGDSPIANAIEGLITGVLTGKQP